MLKEVNLCRVSETNGTNRSCDSERGLETAYVVNGSLFVRLFNRTDLLGVSKVAGKLPGFEKWNLENEKRSQECWYPKTRLQITDGTAKCVGNYWMKFMIVLVNFYSKLKLISRIFESKLRSTIRWSLSKLFREIILQKFVSKGFEPKFDTSDYTRV